MRNEMVRMDSDKIRNINVEDIIGLFLDGNIYYFPDSVDFSYEYFFVNDNKNTILKNHSTKITIRNYGLKFEKVLN